MKTKTLLLCVLSIVLLLAPLATAAAATDAAESPQVIIDGKEPIAVDLIDQDRASDSLALYTRNYGNATAPFGGNTTEYLVIGDILAAVNASGARGTFIPPNGFVISASGTMRSALSDVAVGQIVKTAGVAIPVLPNQYFAVAGVTTAITGTNTVRGAGAVIRFTPEYGASTKQNPWGMELTVVDGKVTHVSENTYPSDNDSPIPANGYVLSIQSGNASYDLLVGKVHAGDTVETVIDSPPYQASAASFNVLNPKSCLDNPAGCGEDGVAFPGYRGADQLIAYDSTYGARTGTNGWGNEIAVNADGFVISNGSNDTAIPQGGYVLSGHGVYRDWLNANAPVGAKVNIDWTTKRVTIIFTPESYLDKASINIAMAEEQVAKSKSEFRDVPYAEIESKLTQDKALFEQAKQVMEGDGLEAALGLLQSLDRELTNTMYLNFESGRVETRGIWLRPKETTVEQVRANLTKLKAININAVYLETWWDGYTTWPTEMSDEKGKLTELNPMYNGFDVLKAYIDEGKKLGIEIHAWVENFFAGGPSVVNHPEWRLTTRDGTDYEVGGGGVPWYWLNPALPQTRDFVSNVYKELLTKYDVASLHLDYARYPGSGDYSNDFGYDAYTRGEFMKQYGEDADPLTLHPGDGPMWDNWLQFRADIINTWVERVAQEAHAIKPDLPITAAVWPNYEDAPQSHAQQTKYWLDHNLIDELFHMSYASGTSVVIDDLNKSLALAQDHALVSSGIDSFQGNPVSAVLDQAKETVQNGAMGNALFEFEGLFNFGYDEPLKLSVFRNEAVKPDYRYTKPFAVIFSEMIRKINEIYVPFGGLSQSDAGKIVKKLESAADKLAKDATMSISSANTVTNTIKQVQHELEKKGSVHAEVLARMNHDLHLASTMVNVYLAKAKNR
ncbi:glycoside hydrolase family 10 protein [Paenibacillus silvisoli]|uniref:glycoside hydrolase family 10 protein n=1 Tax=Paenibacillus silvisoli TaxID=3110539 RepID=UPI002804DC0E|nr:family 10 glycosylhydrolase [Paenibacillus silvisoli]